MAHRVELKISSDPCWLPMVRAMMEQICCEAGFAEEDRVDITIAVDEALSNVVRHSYNGNPDGEIKLRWTADGGCLEILMSDHGQPVDPKRVKPQPPDEFRLAGRGALLIHATMDEVEYRRADGTNSLRLRKYLKPRTGSSYDQKD